MRVAAVFRRALASTGLRWDVDHGRTYVVRDPSTGAAQRRTIDVVVRATRHTPSRASLSLWLVMQCKSSMTDPWVFFRSSEPRGMPAQAVTDTGWEVRGSDGLDLAHLGGWSSHSLISGNVPSCYALVSTTNDYSAKNKARDAVLQTLSAVRGMAKDVPVNRDPTTAAILVPVVVTAAPMFAVGLSHGGGYAVEPSTRELLVGRFEVDDEETRSTWAVHESGVAELTREFVALATGLDYRR